MGTLFRENIERMAGYTPGEQPSSGASIVKLNTNENPYPPSPKVAEALKNFDPAGLRLYPDPMGSEFRAAASMEHGVDLENVIVGNGSDDILTIATRCFVPEGGKMACPSPSYTLYRTLAAIQGAACVEIPLAADFSLPDDFAEQAEGASLLMLPRPNAPTGTAFAKDAVKRLCARFNGVVLIDEAYVEFADDNCLDLALECGNVVVGRTLSKSHSLAGLRLGYAIASNEIVSGMMKVKDSYNVNAISQRLGAVALGDSEWLAKNIARVRESRAKLISGLLALGFDVPESHANFVLASPPDGDAQRIYMRLRDEGVLVRWFDEERVRNYIRVTVGTANEIDFLLEALTRLVPQGERK